MKLPSTLLTLGDNTFNGCTKLRKVVFEEGSALKEIGAKAFAYCISLKRILLPEKLEVIGEKAFECSRLEEITLHDALKEVYEDAFNKCASLRAVYIQDGCGVDVSQTGIPRSVKVGPLPDTVVGNVKVWDLRKKKNIVVPEGTKRIGNSWFWGC